MNGVLEPTIFQPGAHLCSLYQTDEAQQSIVTQFIRHGLERNDKIIYIIDPQHTVNILDILNIEEMNTTSHITRGQMTFLTTHETYLQGNRFDPERMVARLQRETEDAIQEGYAALRVTGDMTWALQLLDSQPLIEYESRLNTFSPKHQCIGLCQYDRRRFDHTILLDVLALHSAIILDRKVYHNPYSRTFSEILLSLTDSP